MTIDDIEQALRRGATQFGPLRVVVQTGGIGGRYQAWVEGPKYNTMLETPDLVDIEGPITFYNRIAPQIADIMQECNQSE